MFKRTLQIFVGVALSVQLAGCFFVHDDRWHHEHDHNYDHHDHDSVDVQVHG